MILKIKINNTNKKSKMSEDENLIILQDELLRSLLFQLCSIYLSELSAMFWWARLYILGRNFTHYLWYKHIIIYLQSGISFSKYPTPVLKALKNQENSSQIISLNITIATAYKLNTMGKIYEKHICNLILELNSITNVVRKF